MSSDPLQSGKFANKREHYLDGLRFLTEARDAQDYAQRSNIEKFEINLELAKALRFTGNLEQATRHLDEAFCLARENEGVDSFNYSCAQREQGLLFYVQHDLGKARDCLLDALRIRKQLLNEPHQSIAEVLSNLCDVESRSGDDQKAVQYVDQAMEMRIQAG